MPMLKKIFSQKRKSRQDNVGNRNTTSKITLDPASAAILSRPFMPLDSRAMSPSDLLDSVGHPMIVPNFRHSSPDLSIYSNNSKINLQEPKKKNKLSSSLKVRNLTESPPPLEQSTTTLKDQIPVSEQQQPSNFSKHCVTPTKSSQSALLLETSREDKTLVEEEKNNNEREVNSKKKAALKEIEDEIEAMVLTTRERSSDVMLSSEAKKQFDILQQKLMEFEYERGAWQKRLQAYMMREEQMRKVIQENQLQINQLRQQQYYYQNSYAPEMRTSKSDNTSNSRHNSYLTASTRSSAYSDDDYYYDDIEDDETELEQQKREVIVDADDEGDIDEDDDEIEDRRRDLISSSYYDRRQYSLPAYYSTPSNNTYPYYPHSWKNYYYEPYYSGGYR